MDVSRNKDPREASGPSSLPAERERVFFSVKSASAPRREQPVSDTAMDQED